MVTSEVFAEVLVGNLHAFLTLQRFLLHDIWDIVPSLFGTFCTAGSVNELFTRDNA